MRTQTQTLTKSEVLHHNDNEATRRRSVRAHDASETAELRHEVVRALPALKAFARRLTGNNADAEDLTQETVARGLANIHQFLPGTNLQAWLITIERNAFYSACRRKRREAEIVHEYASIGRTRILHSRTIQELRAELRLAGSALDRLPDDQRDALVLVCGEGLGYAEAGTVLGCPAGTLKSRVSRGRAKLKELLDSEQTGGAGRRSDQAAYGLHPATTGN